MFNDIKSPEVIKDQINAERSSEITVK